MWPEHAEVVGLFASLLTQWRLGPSGVVGLDYVAIPAVLAMRGVGRKRWGGLFDQLRVMEAAAVKEINKK